MAPTLKIFGIVSRFLYSGGWQVWVRSINWERTLLFFWTHFKPTRKKTHCIHPLPFRNLPLLDPPTLGISVTLHAGYGIFWNHTIFDQCIWVGRHFAAYWMSVDRVSIKYQSWDVDKAPIEILIKSIDEDSTAVDVFCIPANFYQRYKHEIFILKVLGFLKMTGSFLKIPEKVRSLLKTSKVLRSLKAHMNASLLPVLFTSKIRDRKEGIVIYSFFYMVSVPYMGLS